MEQIGYVLIFVIENVLHVAVEPVVAVFPYAVVALVLYVQLSAEVLAVGAPFFAVAKEVRFLSNTSGLVVSLCGLTLPRLSVPLLGKPEFTLPPSLEGRVDMFPLTFPLSIFPRLLF